MATSRLAIKEKNARIWVFDGGGWWVVVAVVVVVVVVVVVMVMVMVMVMVITTW